MVADGPSTVPIGVTRKRCREPDGIPVTSAVMTCVAPLPVVVNVTGVVTIVHVAPLTGLYSILYPLLFTAGGSFVGGLNRSCAVVLPSAATSSRTAVGSAVMVRVSG